MGFPRYERYKDSGVDWLGEIPEHWELRRLKYAAFMQRGHDLSSSNFKDGTIPVYGSNGIIGFHSVATTKSPSITVGRSGSVGEVNFVAQDFWAHNTTLFLLKSFGNNIHFLYYLLKSLDLKSHSAGSAVGSLNRNHIHQIPIGRPPIAEQKRIADFLDRKCNEIDEAIAKKQRLIELLDEQKTILINQAVTKGLDPDVPMKDSGIDWLGEIPEHWKTLKLKHIFKFRGGATPSKDNLEFWNGEINWFTPKDMKQRYLSSSSTLITEKALEKTRIEILRVNTILIVVRGMILAKRVPIAIVKEAGTINQDMKGLEFKSDEHAADFFAILLEGINNSISPILEEAGHGTKTLPTKNLSQFYLPVPTKKEQIEILKFVHKLESEMDDLLAKLRKENQILVELKQILIAEAVTGKIKI